MRTTNRIFFILLLAFSLAQPSLGADKAKKKRRASKATSSRSLASTGSNAHLLLGLGIVASGGTNGVGFNVAAFFKPKRRSRTYLGLETGLHIIGFSSVGGTPIGLPIMAALYKEMGNPKKGAAKPYLGLSVGPYIGLSGTATTGLAIFIKPGVYIPMDTVALNVELRFGGINGGFFMFPQANIAISL